MGLTQQPALFEQQHAISNNVVYVFATSKTSDQSAHTRSLMRAFTCRLNILCAVDQKTFTGDCTGSSESTLVKMPYCWKSQVAAQLSSQLSSKY